MAAQAELKIAITPIQLLAFTFGIIFSMMGMVYFITNAMVESQRAYAEQSNTITTPSVVAQADGTVCVEPTDVASGDTEIVNGHVYTKGYTISSGYHAIMDAIRGITQVNEDNDTTITYTTDNRNSGNTMTDNRNSGNSYTTTTEDNRVDNRNSGNTTTTTTTDNRNSGNTNRFVDNRNSGNTNTNTNTATDNRVDNRNSGNTTSNTTTTTTTTRQNNGNSPVTVTEDNDTTTNQNNGNTYN